MTPIRPSVSPLPSFATRPDDLKPAVPSISWAKRAARWLASLKKRAAADAGKA